MIDDISQFFGIVFFFFLFSLILIGLPTVALKLILSLCIKHTEPKARRMIAGRSLAAALVSDFLAICTYFAMTMSKGVVPLWGGHWMPGEVGAGLILAILVLGLDIWIWRRARTANSPFRAAIWLCGSNIWLIWTFTLMWAFGSYELSRPCYDYPGQLETLGVDVYDCAADARSYWAQHPDLWESARDAAGH
jgi:hypothetical protein